MKLVPIKVMVVAELPTMAEFGLMLVSVGTGLLTVKVCAVVALPPGATTFMELAPAAARSAAGIIAVSWVALTNVVASGTPVEVGGETVDEVRAGQGDGGVVVAGRR